MKTILSIALAAMRNSNQRKGRAKAKAKSRRHCGAGSARATKTVGTSTATLKGRIANMMVFPAKSSVLFSKEVSGVRGCSKLVMFALIIAVFLLSSGEALRNSRGNASVVDADETVKDKAWWWWMGDNSRGEATEDELGVDEKKDSQNDVVTKEEGSISATSSKLRSQTVQGKGVGEQPLKDDWERGGGVTYNWEESAEASDDGPTKRAAQQQMDFSSLVAPVRSVQVKGEGEGELDGNGDAIIFRNDEAALLAGAPRKLSYQVDGNDCVTNGELLL